MITKSSRKRAFCVLTKKETVMFTGRYLAGILASYIVIFAVGFYVPLGICVRIGMMLALLFAVSMSIFLKNRRIVLDKRRCVTFFLAVALLLFSSTYSGYFQKESNDAMLSYTEGNAHTVCAAVKEVRYERSYASAYILTNVVIDGEKLWFDVLWDIPFGGGLAPGNEICFEGITESLPDGYQYYYRAKKIFISFASESFTLTGRETITPSFFQTVRSYISENFQNYLGDRAGYASALLVGDRDGLDEQTKLAYQRLGISHILAISGMHFSVVMGGIDLFLRGLTVPKKRKNVFLILFSCAFALVCGFSSSVMRALLMFGIYYIADLFGEESDAPTSLCIAISCIITVNPFLVYDAGLWLSAFSTLGIILVMPSLKACLKGKGILKKVLHAVVCMTVMNLTSIFFTMPVIYFLYGGISLISPITNLIFIPLTEIILYLLMLLTVTGFVPVIANLLGNICGLLIDVTESFSQYLSDIKGIYISIRYPFATVILALLVLSMLFVLLAKKFRLRRLFVIFLSTVIAFGISFCIYRQSGKDSTYLYLNTDGKNDVITLVDNGEVVLFDITNGGRSVPLCAMDAPSYYRCEIDTYVLTHLHDHHAATLKALADEIKIHRVLLPEAETEKDSAYIADIIMGLDDAVDIAFYKRTAEATITVGETVVSLPEYKTITRSTHPTIVFSGETDGVGAWIYCGASSMEFSEHWDDVMQYRAVILGSNGPKVKNIFDDNCLSMAEVVLFTSEDTFALVNTEKIRGEFILVQEKYHILFQH